MYKVCKVLPLCLLAFSLVHSPALGAGNRNATLSEKFKVCKDILLGKFSAVQLQNLTGESDSKTYSPARGAQQAKQEQMQPKSSALYEGMSRREKREEEAALKKEQIKEAEYRATLQRAEELVNQKLGEASTGGTLASRVKASHLETYKSVIVEHLANKTLNINDYDSWKFASVRNTRTGKYFDIVRTSKFDNYGRIDADEIIILNTKKAGKSMEKLWDSGKVNFFETRKGKFLSLYRDDGSIEVSKEKLKDINPMDLIFRFGVSESPSMLGQGGERQPVQVSMQTQMTQQEALEKAQQKEQFEAKIQRARELLDAKLESKMDTTGRHAILKGKHRKISHYRKVIVELLAEKTLNINSYNYWEIRSLRDMTTGEYYDVLMVKGFGRRGPHKGRLLVSDEVFLLNSKKAGELFRSLYKRGADHQIFEMNTEEIIELFYDDGDYEILRIDFEEIHPFDLKFRYEDSFSPGLTPEEIVQKFLVDLIEARPELGRIILKYKKVLENMVLARAINPTDYLELEIIEAIDVSSGKKELVVVNPGAADPKAYSLYSTTDERWVPGFRVFTVSEDPGPQKFTWRNVNSLRNDYIYELSDGRYMVLKQDDGDVDVHFLKDSSNLNPIDLLHSYSE